jgi:hypothetical protein
MQFPVKRFILPAISSLLVATANAQQPTFNAEAYLIGQGGETEHVWITAATDTSIRYRETEVSVDLKDRKLAEIGTIYLFEPREFTEAIRLFQGRSYEEARQRFAQIRERHRPVLALKGNFGTLAGFYEMECLRELGNLEGLSKALASFIKEPLVRQHHLRQVDLYVLWDAVRTKSWPRVDALARERESEPLSGPLRAQVAYCQGVALEAMERPADALKAFNVALTADSGASVWVARNAALGVMRIHLADPEVKTAMKLWGTPDEIATSVGHFRLMEAAAVARLFEQSLGAGASLPADFQPLLKYAGQPGDA